MGKFNASLRLPGDSQALEAVVRVQEGRITVASGEHEIGDWEIGRVELTRIPEGFRLESEGEVILLDIPDRASFEEEANSMSGKKRRAGRSRKATTEKTRPDKRKPGKPRAEKSKIDKPLRTTPTATAVSQGSATTSSGIDRFLAGAESRFGTMLPKWVFTRGGLIVVVAMIALVVIFAELVSNLLLIAGVIGLLVGGITMLDSVIARKLLRHRITPIKVVIAGGSIFVAGLLLGVLA